MDFFEQKKPQPAVGIVLALGFFLALGVLTPCTPGSAVKPITVGLRIEPTTTAFSTNQGWSVEMTKGLLYVQRIEFYEGEPSYTALLPVPLPLPLLQWGSLLGAEAWAHPGHDKDGKLKGENLPSKALDLMDKKGIDLGSIGGFSGYWGIADIRLDAKSLVAVEGKASKDGKEIAFAFSLAGDPSQIPGIAVQKTLETTATLAMQIQARGWFDLLDFGALPVTGGKASLPADSSQTTIFHKALLKPNNYVFSN